MARMPMPGMSMSKPAGPLAPPPPTDPMGGDDESQEPPCHATITSDQLDEIKQNGTLELQGDDGEQVILTLDEGEGSEGAPPPNPDSMNGDSATTA